MTSTQKESTGAIQLKDDDCLLGRGAFPNEHKGNIAFRATIARFRPSYTATTNRKMKNNIARKAIRAMEESGARFVQRVSGSEDTYEIVSDAVVLEKTKQALRHLERPRGRRRAQAKRAIKQQVSPQPNLPDVAVAQTGIFQNLSTRERQLQDALRVLSSYTQPSPSTLLSTLSVTNALKTPSLGDSSISTLSSLLAMRQRPSIVLPTAEDKLLALLASSRLLAQEKIYPTSLSPSARMLHSAKATSCLESKRQIQI